MTSIEKDDVAEITNHNGEKVKVPKLEENIKKELHFKQGYEDLNKHLNLNKRKKVFLHMSKRLGSFDDMAIEEAKKPTGLFTQHFMLQKPPKYTRPNLQLAHIMSMAAIEITQPRPKSTKYVQGGMTSHAKSSNINKEPYLYASHMQIR